LETLCAFLCFCKSNNFVVKQKFSDAFWLARNNRHPHETTNTKNPAKQLWGSKAGCGIGSDAVLINGRYLNGAWLGEMKVAVRLENTYLVIDSVTSVTCRREWKYFQADRCTWWVLQRVCNCLGLGARPGCERPGQYSVAGSCDSPLPFAVPCLCCS